MSDYKSFENYSVKEMVLEYADKKYTHVIMKKEDPDVCSDVIWCLCESETDAIKCVESETEGNDPDYQFYYEKIIPKKKYIKNPNFMNS